MLVASRAWIYYVNHYPFIHSRALQEGLDLVGAAWINYGIRGDAFDQVQKLAHNYRVWKRYKGSSMSPSFKEARDSFNKIQNLSFKQTNTSGGFNQPNDHGTYS